MAYINDFSHTMEVGECYYSSSHRMRFCVIADMGDHTSRFNSIGTVPNYKILWADGFIGESTVPTLLPITNVEALYRASGVQEALYRANEALKRGQTHIEVAS